MNPCFLCTSQHFVLCGCLAADEVAGNAAFRVALEHIAQL